MSGVGLRGVSAAQDVRFSDKEKKLFKSMKFPKEYEMKVDLRKVNWEVMKVWIAQRVTELLGVEDEVLIQYVIEQLEGKQTVDPRVLQINLTGFLEKNTALFCKELWGMVISAAQNESGIPQKILDEKAEELRKKKEIQDAINEKLKAERLKREEESREAARKRDEERRKERESRGGDRREEGQRREEGRRHDRDRDARPRTDRGSERRPSSPNRQRSGRESPPRRHKHDDRERLQRKRGNTPDPEERRERQRRKERRSGSRERLPGPPPLAQHFVKSGVVGGLLQQPAVGQHSPAGNGSASPASPKLEEVDTGDGAVGDKDKKDKKKHKKEKKDRKEKKEKKRLKKERQQSEQGAQDKEASGSDSDNAGKVDDQEAKKKLEEDLRQQALEKIAGLKQ